MIAAASTATNATILGVIVCSLLANLEAADVARAGAYVGIKLSVVVA